MGGFCGYIVLDDRISPETVSQLSGSAKTLSRRAEDSPLEIGTARARFWFYNLDGTGSKDAAGCVTGNPVVVEAGAAQAVETGRQSVLKALRAGDVSLLDRCQGSYSVFSWTEETGELHIVADKFGTRPVYYFRNDALIAFATSLRVIFDMCRGLLTVDATALGQQVYTQQIFGNRTLAKEIRTLRGGERLCWRKRHLDIVRYYDIENTPRKDVPYEAAVDSVFNAFIEAVRRRVSEPRAYAMLSGGLDSRAVVAALRELEVEVQSFAFARSGSPDAVLSPRIAKQLGTRHRLVAFELKERIRSAPFMAFVARYMPHPDGFPPCHIIWSGDGGSVGLGHVYMTDAGVAQARAGNVEQAVAGLFPALTASTKQRTLRAAHALEVRTMAFESICEEMAAGRDDERRMFMFLMRNDQERHLHQYFENIDLWRLNPVLPFFDSDFLETVYRLPQDYFLKHRLYNDFIARFRLGAERVAWQAYRGHLPGPVKMDLEKDQWDLTKAFEKEPLDAYLKWIRAYRNLPLRDLHRFVNPWFVRYWSARMRLRLGRRLSGITLISSFVLLCGQLTDDTDEADLDNEVVLTDS